jgi:hypothetical protein
MDPGLMAATAGTRIAKFQGPAVPVESRAICMYDKKLKKYCINLKILIKIKRLLQ